MTASLFTWVRPRLAWIVFCSLSAMFAGEARATVTVQTVDGRELVGEIDERTNAEQLWIRREAKPIVLATSVRWDSIVNATMDGKRVEVATLAETWPGLKSRGPEGIFSLAAGVPSVVGQTRSRPRPRRAKIAALEIDAILVNLDRDVEPDGFELVITALDRHGRSVPVRGTLSARLVGERDKEHLGGIRFDELQRWSRPVACADFEEGLASYRLRFRTVRPEFDWELIPYALLHVRLGVYGEGNFEASVPVMIRQFNPLRDQMQKYSRSRFFRGELTEQVHANSAFGIRNWD